MPMNIDDRLHRLPIVGILRRAHRNRVADWPIGFTLYKLSPVAPMSSRAIWS